MANKKKQQRETNTLLVVVIIILVVMLGLLLWLLLKPQDELTRIPTGNVDIFDIEIGCLCEGENCGDKGSSGSNSSDKEGQRGTVNGRTDTEISDAGIVYVDDANGMYVYQKALKIFENAAFEYTSKIAPGVSNSYNFKVHNETKSAIRYNIDFEESSEYAINMLYRLKRGGAYVIGDDTTWVSGSELKMANIRQLAIDGVDNYTLDWKWPYDGGNDMADTVAGEKMTSEYSLGIKVNFKEM